MRSLFVAAVMLASLIGLPASGNASVGDAVAARPSAGPARPTTPATTTVAPTTSGRDHPRTPGRPAGGIGIPVARPTVAPTVSPTISPTVATTGIARVSVGAPRRAALGFTADSIVVEKGMRRLTLWANSLPLRTYDVALGQTPTGAKVRRGDNRTPEGLYHVEARNPFSQYHLGLRVSYPNAQDLARARALGVDPGGDIMIHGLPNGQGQVGTQHKAYDWTNGCVAVTDEEIEEIWSAVPVGTPIRILP
jgi:lipoprotein-anchoring transpeptidase ErfK/SrfK